MLPLQEVRQRHFYGCGIATIANLVGKSYDVVLNRTLKLKKLPKSAASDYHNSKLALQTEEFTSLLSAYKRKYKVSRSKSVLNDMKTTTVIWYRSMPDFSHAVVYNPQDDMIYCPFSGVVPFYKEDYNKSLVLTIQVYN